MKISRLQSSKVQTLCSFFPRTTLFFYWQQIFLIGEHLLAATKCQILLPLKLEKKPPQIEPEHKKEKRQDFHTSALISHNQQSKHGIYVRLT